MTNIKKEYSYRELGRMKRARAIVSVDKEIRNVLKLNTGSHWINKVIIECIISVPKPIFDNKGTVKLLSPRNEKITKESLQKIYDQCQKLDSYE